MTIHWGIIGCGDVARKRVAAAIQADPHSELVAACRRDEGQLNEFCDQFGVPHRYLHDTDLIKNDQIDAVYIATPVSLHLPQTLASLAAGKHVLVEKPMAMTTTECQQMETEAHAAQKVLSVAFYRRYYPAYRRIKQILADGTLGDLLAVNIVTSAPLGMAPGEDGYWRVLLEHGGGGPLMDVGSHRLDLLLDLLGPVKSVKAETSRVAADYESENVATLALTFRGGVQCALQCLFGAAVDPDVFTLVGTRGTLDATPLNTGTLRLSTAEGTTEEKLPPADNFSAPLIADFVSAIQNVHDPLVTAKHAIEVNEVMERAYRSARG